MKRIWTIAFLCLLAVSAWAQRYHAGDAVPEAYLKVFGYDRFFRVSPISDDMQKALSACSYKGIGGVKWEDLRYLQVLHRDLDGNTMVGELVCSKKISDDLMEIFKALYQAGYPIEKMRLIELYDGDDEASMRDNNTSCFNQREITAGGKCSRHSFGMAIDINPRYNPYYKLKASGNAIVRPEGSIDYLDRFRSFSYKIEKGDLCYRLFKQHGFRWGGEWLRGKDYQHFEK
ncbi:MAG: M15 family metallopeptidase [Bacteroidales bacterium]|nr:M15 family metallopeptidase [Bacteroidales bacterium]